MAFEILGQSLDTVAVIGSGQIGPDIALYFAKVLHEGGTRIVVVDVSADALERGRAKLEKKIDRGVKSGAFSPEKAAAMKTCITWTDDYERVRGATFVVEAATEDEGLKGKIFAQLEQLCGPDAVFASNSSHLEPERIFANLKHKRRTCVIHYFFPAERNPIVEIVPGADTDPALTAALMSLYEGIGKVPIEVGSRYGYAIDPIFEGLFQAAALLVEAGAGTTREVDAAACRALGYTVGPFTAMNLTGGNPITHHGLAISGERLMPWFRSPALLADRMKTGEPWETPRRGETVELPREREERIASALRGAYFALVGHVLDSGITNAADLDMAIEIALDMTPPFRMMNELGPARALELARAYCESQNGFALPQCLVEQAASGEPWPIETIRRRDVGAVAVITVRRPKVLNALNRDAFLQLERHFEAIRDDDSIVGAVLTGFGVKAFVSGADVNFLAAIETAEQGEATSAESNRVVCASENVGKPTVCAMNGFAFGGGNEIAMACNARIASAGLRVLAGQPEPNLGIIPGAGGTQRLPRWIGIEAAAELLRTGKPISAQRALELGLVSRLVDGDVVAEAIAMVEQAAAGTLELPAIERGPIPAPDRLPDLELGHLSRAVDRILVRAILDGARMPLAEGVALEARLFGEVCKTRDMRIGVDNFIENGPGSKAPFVNE